MKKTISKKLMVSRTTIRNLAAPEIERAAGGQTKGTCTDICSEHPTICDLDTLFVHGCNSFR